MKEAFIGMKGILGVLPKVEFVNRDEVMTTWGPAGNYNCQNGYHYTIETRPSVANQIDFKVECARMEGAHNCKSYTNTDQHTLNVDLRHIWYKDSLVDSGWPSNGVYPPSLGDTYVTTNDFFLDHTLTAQFKNKSENDDTTVCVNNNEHTL
jgi:hypothetical protein